MRSYLDTGCMVLISVFVVVLQGCDSTRSSGDLGSDTVGVGVGGVPASSVAAGSGDAIPSTPQSVANSPATTTESDALAATAIPNGIAKIHGKYYAVRNGKGTLLDQRERFAEGLYFEANGRITLKDGNIVRLRNGEMVTFAGERRDVPLNIRLPSPLPEGMVARNSVR